ncbi:MAG: glycosyltransferase [Lachnospiraceae bacterium]|nr:glycosyltransferase [Lachnospiraceae bacterium]
MDIRSIRKGIEKLRDYTERNGVEAALFRTLEGIRESAENRLYSREALMIPESTEAGEETGGIFLSLIIPVFEPDMDDFAHLLDSILGQSYTDFEVVIADGSGNDDIENVVRTYDEDPDIGLKIKYRRLGENKGISENTNEAIRDAEGEYLVFLDHDDFIEPDALSETVRAIRNGAELVYTDEDKYDGLRDRYISVNRKPDFNLDLLLSNNYICHMLTVKKEAVERAGFLRPEYDGAQDHDLILRLSETVPREKIAHIPKVLYHWRITDASTAGNPKAKLYAYENGRKAVEDYFRRRGIRASVSDSSHRGFFHTDYSKADVSPEDSCLFIDNRLVPLTPDTERRLKGYFSRKEAGIVGGRIIGRSGRTLSNGYVRDEYGRRVPEYGKIDYRFSGYMHRASMARETEAVSVHAFAVRRELLPLVSRDAFAMCERIRSRGYSVIVDPEIIFRIK